MDFSRRLTRVVALGAALASSPACTAKITGQGSAAPAVVDVSTGGAAGPNSPSAARCIEGARGRSEQGMRRFSQREYLRTLTAVFGAELLQGVPALGQFPNDVIVSSVQEFQALHALEHADAVSEVALQLSQAFVTQSAALSELAPACLATGLQAGLVEPACARELVASLGSKLFGRPPSAEQLERYVAALHPAEPELASLPEAERLQLVIARLLQAPDVLFHRAVSSADAVDGRARVDAFSVASRLSYRLTESSPDGELLTLAQSGKLLEPQTLRAQARRLLEGPQGHERVRGLFSHWLRLGRLLPPHAAPLGRAGLPADDAGREQLRQELVSETLDFAEHVVFAPDLSFASLFNAPLAFPESDSMAKILGLPAGTRGLVELTDARRGLIMRPALLASAREREAPILRGITLRVRLLCEELPPPPANASDVADAVTAELDPAQLSTRELASKVTAGSQCQSCHARLNPLGFALGHFGPLGEWRDSERVYAASGELENEFPIDTSVAGAAVATPGDAVADQTELSELLGASDKAKDCLARYAFRFTRLRLETPDDACQLDDIRGRLVTSASLIDALVEAVAADDIFYQGVAP